MRAIDRKLRRDLWHLRGQAIAIALVVASGTATLVMSLNTLGSLESSQQAYYDRYHFADVFASVTRAPRSVADRIAHWPGVGRVEPRIVKEVTMDVPGLREPAIARLSSMPDGRPARVNQIHLRRGRMAEVGRRDEVVASEAFAEAHGFGPGDTMQAVLNGRRETLRIVGVGLSPEFVFQIRSGSALPDDQRFGVLWMSEATLAAAFDMEGAFNDLVLTLRRDASEAAIVSRLDIELARYGSTGAYGRDEQVSARFLQDEIKQLRGTAFVIPIIFFGVAAFLLNVVMSRLVNTQREEIAALKAFGYSGGQIGRHFMTFVTLIVLVGVVVGVIVGAWMGKGVTEMYTRFYRFPVFTFHLDPAVVVMSIGVAVAAGILGTSSAVRRAAALPPAEAMRPEPPATYRPSIVERLGLQRRLPQTVRMIIRQLERRPFKTAMSSLGIAAAVAILVLGQFGMDAMDAMMEFEFERVQTEDMTVGFVEATSAGVLHEMRRLPGVQYVEPFRSLPVRLRHGHRSRRLGLLGLPERPHLHRPLDSEGRRVRLTSFGLTVSSKLADLLGAEVGDRLQIDVLAGERRSFTMPVARVVKDYAGINAYLSLEALHELEREDAIPSGVFLAVDDLYRDTLYAELKATPRVADVTVREAVIESFVSTVAENQLKFQGFIVMFAVIIAFGVVYNTARISVSERGRELATLRVMGFTRGEVSSILIGELMLVTMLAIPVGMLIGYGLAGLVVNAFESEMYRIPLVIDRASYAQAGLITLTAALASGLLVRRRLDRLDLVAVLKAKE